MKKSLMLALTAVIALFLFSPAYAADKIALFDNMGFYTPPDLPVRPILPEAPAKEPPAFTFEPPVLEYDPYGPPDSDDGMDETSPDKEAPESDMATLSEDDENDTPTEGLVPLDIKIPAPNNDGIARASIPIAVPPGRAGIAPNLALSYSSEAKNGIVGVGWDLTLGTIQRNTKDGLNYSGNKFLFNGAELVERSGWGTGCYEKKIESDFSKYCYNSGTGWVVTNKKGIKYYYGATSNSRKTTSLGDQEIFAWYLDKVIDLNGNYMMVYYTTFDGEKEIYPDRIEYTGNENTGHQPKYKVQFHYEPRTDDPYVFTINDFLRTSRRMTEIEVSTTANGYYEQIRRYALDYLPGYSPATKRSTLRQVTQFGTDNSYLPPVELTDQNQDATFMEFFDWPGGPVSGGETDKCITGDFNGDAKNDLACHDSDTTWKLAMSKLHPDGWDVQTWYNGPPGTAYFENYKCTTGDFNGDGMTDITCFLASGVWRMYLSTGAGWDYHEWNNGPYPGDYFAERCTTGDFNRDGYTDLMCRHDGTGVWNIYTASGSGWNAPAGYPGPGYGDYFADRCITGDFDGDGRTDIGRYADTNIYEMFLSTDPGWGKYNWSTEGFPIGTPFYAKCMTGDFNGDGKTDLACKNGGGNWKMFFSTGKNWYITDFGNGINIGTQGARRVKTGDFNGDGKTDMLFHNDREYANGLMALSTGKAWVLLDWAHDAPNARRCKAADFNGDGRTDIACNRKSGGVFTYDWYMMLSDIEMPDLLRTVKNPLGGETTIDYLSSCYYENTYLPYVTQTVSAITTDDKNNNINSSFFSYRGGLYDPPDREFRGFSNFYVMDPIGNNTETVFYQDSVRRGMPKHYVTNDAEYNVYTGAIYSYEITSPHTGVSFPKLIQKNEYLFDGSIPFEYILDGRWDDDPSKFIQTVVEYEYDTYGNVTRNYSHGNESIQGDERDEYTEYDYFTADWILSLPKRVYVRNSSGLYVSVAWFQNNQSTGNLEIKTNWLNPAGSATLPASPDGDDPVTRYFYYSNGNLHIIRDPRGYDTTFEYDAPTSTYVTRKTNALTHYVQSTYDYRFGKPLTATDANGNTAYYQYDVFGRIAMVTDPDGMDRDVHTVYDYDLANRVITASIRKGAAELSYNETSYDALGRTIKTRTPGPEGKVIVTRTEYYDQNQLYRNSLPYFEGIETERWTTIEHDLLNRVIQITNPDNTSFYHDYYLGAKTVIDPNGHVKQEIRDVFGRLVQVREYTGTYDNPTLYATTNYQYDILGNLTKVIDTKGNQTTITYDTLSRKTTMRDPDMGYWTYEYDLNGNLYRQTDAKNKTITFTYDQLNRVTLKDYPAGTDINYYYDEGTSTNPIGRLTRVTDNSGTTYLWYDKIGRTRKTTKTISSVNYTTQTFFDDLKRVDHIIYPDDTTLDYTYCEPTGLISQAGGYASFYDYNAMGQPGTVTYGNGVTTTYTYRTDNNRLNTLVTVNGSADLQNLSYSYDNKGNVTGITDNRPGGTRSVTLEYDDLDRMTYASSPSYNPYGPVTYEYNEIGNIIRSTEYLGMTYTYYYSSTSRPHAVISISSVSSLILQYDNNGNVTRYGGTTLTYNYDNMMTALGSNTYVYDYSGQRIKKNTTVYIGNLYEKTGSTVTRHIFAGSQRIAQHSGSTIYYYHGDHLGSTSIVTGTNGTLQKEMYYYPFGRTYYTSGSPAIKYKFTSAEEDSLGFYHLGARYYDPTIGRFVSADSIVPDYSDPQTLNRYSYCRNNPLIYTDPSGHIFGIDDLLAIGIGAAIGALSAGAQSDWDIGAMAAGALIGGISAGVGFGSGSWAYGAVGGGDFGLVAGGVVGGAAGGATGGGLSAAFYGGNIGEGILKGTGYGSIAGGVTGGLIALGVPNAIAAAGGGYSSGYAQCGGNCGAEGALYSFAGAIAHNALTIAGVGADGKVPAQGTPEWEAMRAQNATYGTTPEISFKGTDTIWLLTGLLGSGHSHTWHTRDYAYEDALGQRHGYVPSGHYYKFVQGNVPYPGQNYSENGWNNFRYFSNNCTSRFGYLHPASYYSHYNYPGQGAYWWGW